MSALSPVGVTGAPEGLEGVGKSKHCISAAAAGTSSKDFPILRVRAMR